MKLYKYRWYDPIRIPILCAPLLTGLRMVVMLITYLMPVVQIGATTWLIDGALKLLQQKSEWKTLIFPVVLLAVTIAISRMGSVASSLLEQGICNKIRTGYTEFLIRKCASVPYEKIEDADIWDLIARVKDKPDEILLQGFKSSMGILGVSVQMAGFLGILFFQVWWSVICIIFLAALVMKFAMKGGEEQYDAHREMTKYVRQYEYIGDVLTSREAVEERTVFAYFPFLQKKWEEMYQQARSREKVVTIKSMVRMKIVSISMIGIMCCLAAILFPAVKSGSMTIGLYISMVQAVGNLMNIMSWELSDDIGTYSKYKEYIKDFIKFCNLPEVRGVRDMPSEQSIKFESLEFKDVSFTYPGTSKKCLDHVSFRLEEGKHYALVGGNGAGKTTIIKLITGLYSDFQGEILINGKSIRKYEFSQLKSMYAAVFQDFARYEISLKDNVALGDINNMWDEKQKEKICWALALLGLEKRIESFPQKLDTFLGKLETEGQDLSGGEWQRVAMARAMISPASMLILDEPTAALDPINESRLYEEFGKISHGRTTLFISHRLGSTMLADEIIVLNEGKIVQQGSHEELMADCELYRQMYESQRSWYTNEAN